jgi:excisionase family DNA binding protein
MTNPTDAAVPASAPAQPDVLNVEQAAAFLGLSVASTAAALKSGSIPARRVGRRWLISRDALVAWLSGQSGPAAAGQAVS